MRTRNSESCNLWGDCVVKIVNKMCFVNRFNWRRWFFDTSFLTFVIHFSSWQILMLSIYEVNQVFALVLYLSRSHINWKKKKKKKLLIYKCDTFVLWIWLWLYIYGQELLMVGKAVYVKRPPANPPAAGPTFVPHRRLVGPQVSVKCGNVECVMRKVKCGMQSAECTCGMVCRMRNAESL